MEKKKELTINKVVVENGTSAILEIAHLIHPADSHTITDIGAHIHTISEVLCAHLQHVTTVVVVHAAHSEGLVVGCIAATVVRGAVDGGAAAAGVGGEGQRGFDLDAGVDGGTVCLCGWYCMVIKWVLLD
jgi:hypothetical protein